jgi:excinuclease ABC subunit C
MSLSPLEIQVQTLPESAGVYQYFDADGQLIYVGKAKNIKKRVKSYFTKQQQNGKTRALVRKIDKVSHIVVASEKDALLLENNLIKENRPRYNVLLKDDKTYPWICIKKERFPRVFSTRRVINDGSKYFGPYTSGKTVSTLLGLIKELYGLRTCKFDLSESKIEAKKYKVCLEYHLGNCKGACEGLESESSYEVKIRAIKNILKGNFGAALQNFKAEMLQLAEEMKFEDAQRIKEKIDTLENYQSKSTIVNPKISHVDVFSIVSDTTHAYVNFLQVSYGAIIRSHTLEIKKKLDEDDDHLLALAIIELRSRFKLESKELYLPFHLDLGDDLKINVPQLGDKKHLVDLSRRNATYFRLERFKQIKMVDPDRHADRIMAQMKSDLRLSEEPRHIECFDNSNIQGAHPVAACVVFKNGKASKSDYRHFNIKTVEGPDDFASMEEVVFRRYKRLLDEKMPLPQLIVVDGGKGQLNASLRSLDRLGLRGKVAIIGIAKRLEEIYFPKDPIPLYLDKKSESLKIIQQLRNEAHRFGITHHRGKRISGTLQTALWDIPGIGAKTSEALLKHFKSVKRVSFAKIDELEPVVGTAKAEKIYHYFNPTSNETK